MDEDRYWRGGIYNNPHDQRTLVEKRVGYGQTLNVGTRKGKLLYYGTMISVGLLLLGVFFLFVALDNAEYTLQIDAGSVVVGAPLYGYSFSLVDVQDINLLNEMPGGTRTNGAETMNYALGNFQMTGYGKSKLYVYKGNPPYLAIQLPDLYLFFSAKTAEETVSYYNTLQALVP